MFGRKNKKTEQERPIFRYAVHLVSEDTSARKTFGRLNPSFQSEVPVQQGYVLKLPEYTIDIIGGDISSEARYGYFEVKQVRLYQEFLFPEWGAMSERRTRDYFKRGEVHRPVLLVEKVNEPVGKERVPQDGMLSGIAEIR